MSNLIFKKLIIFFPVGELAKIVELHPGLNVVTSRRIDGNDLGKSIIAKSFYHCLGADCKFDGKFDAASKVFILVLEYEGNEYTFYRSGSLYKMFNSNLNILWSTSHRHELGKRFYEQFGFAIWLPSRSTKETEIAPPAYSFSPYFVDQNQYGGSEFRSFSNLEQYPNFKADLIYTFSGACDKLYFELKAQKESLDVKTNELKDSIELNKAMSEQVSDELSSLGYSANMTTLAIDSSEHEFAYKSLSEKLGKLRSQLYKYREQRAQTQLALAGAEALGRHLDKSIEKFDGETCPLCNSRIDDPLSIRVSACVAQTDALILGDELEKELDSINRKIAGLEALYEQRLKELDTLKASMEFLRNNDITVVQVEGLTRLSEKLTNERGYFEEQLDCLNKSLNVVSGKMAKYSEKRSDVNKRYVEIVTSYVRDLNLQSIDLDKIKQVTNRFEAGGSNAPLATVAWYFALLKLKDEFNPDRVCLPLILDSPMNVEADDDKYENQYKLIFEKFKYKYQMLVTGLGLADSPVVPKDANVIVLDNEKYRLLNAEDFEATKDMVFACMEQH